MSATGPRKCIQEVLDSPWMHGEALRWRPQRPDGGPKDRAGTRILRSSSKDKDNIALYTASIALVFSLYPL